jgi:Cyclic nucleotide-binding domain
VARCMVVDASRIARFLNLADLPAKELEELAAVMSEVEVEAGATIITVDDYGTAIYFVEEGTADVLDDGDETTKTLGPGETFGEIWTSPDGTADGHGGGAYADATPLPLRSGLRPRTSTCTRGRTLAAPPRYRARRSLSAPDRRAEIVGEPSGHLSGVGQRAGMSPELGGLQQETPRSKTTTGLFGRARAPFDSDRSASAARWALPRLAPCPTKIETVTTPRHNLCWISSGGGQPSSSPAWQLP